MGSSTKSLGKNIFKEGLFLGWIYVLKHILAFRIVSRRNIELLSGTILYGLRV